MSSPRRPVNGRVVILVMVMAVLAVTLAIPVREWLAQRAAISALQSDVAQSKARVADLERQAADWEDPAFVAAQARSRLHFIFPGETGYVVLGADDRPMTANGQQTAAAEPWYQLLWDSTRQADVGP